MADLTTVTDEYFTIAHESFEDNLANSIAALAATVALNNATEYTDGESVVLTVDPGTALEATFTGIKSGNNITGCKWTEGNLAVGHDAGATVIDYIAATHHNMMTKGLQVGHNPDGTFKTQPVRDALGLTDPASAGWEVAPYTFSVQSGYNQGNKSFEVRGNNADLTDELSPGMRMKFSRSTTPPTQCTDLEASSSQYATRASGSLTGITFTDDFVVEAWIKLESYAAMSIIGRFNGTSGWDLQLDVSGVLILSGRNAAVGNYSRVQTLQSIPLNRWVHIAAQLDMSAFTATSTTSYIMIDSMDVPVTVSRAGTNPVALIQAGDLQIGALNSVTFFDGKISDVRLWSAKRTQSEIKDNMNQQLLGSETNLAGYWKLNGNFNDSTTNLNNLTGSGGAVATDLDNPMKSVEYGIVTKVTYSAPHSTVTLFTGTDHAIPNMTLSSPHYSAQKAPFGFPVGEDKWVIDCYFSDAYATTSVSAVALGPKGTIGIGSWTVDFTGLAVHVSTSGAVNRYESTFLSTDAATQTNRKLIHSIGGANFAASAGVRMGFHTSDTVSHTAVTTYTMMASTVATTGEITVANSSITFKCAYL